MLIDELKRRQLTIVTDGEPDDLIALLLLQRAGWLENASIVVNSWRDPQSKAHFVCQALGLVNLYIGEPSDTNFSYGQHSQEFQSWKPELFQEALVLCLAPPRELLLSDTKLLRNSTLAIYGSFNLRSLLGEGVKADRIIQLLDSFERVVYYETQLAVGAHSAVHDSALLNLLPAEIIRAISLWNQHSQSYGEKIAESIAACPLQFVNADTGLVATLLMPRPACHLVRSRLTCLAPTRYVEPGSIEVVIGIDSQAFSQQQISWMIEQLSSPTKPR